MCGLAGLLAGPGRGEGELRATAERMTGTIRHRGPDDDGVFVDAAHGVALGFRRLAILDLSPAGHQPMQSVSGRYTIIFNGEVYNFAELRRELEQGGATFRGHSDTEVMLAAYECWGIAAATRRFRGMFAMAVWDAERRALVLVRDRLGIKPMFVYQAGGLVAFASELKSLHTLPGFDRTIDRPALASYLRHLYVPAPRSIYRQVSKLPPGHLLTITDPRAPLPCAEQYWSVEEAAARGLAQPFAGSAQDAVGPLDELLKEAVRLRMIADVPLGALLSGGVDSSTVVALMQELASGPVKTFSIAFDQVAYNEAPHAAAVARHLGTDHTELMVTGDVALSVVPRLPDMFDEPLADPSQIPTYLVCELARREVTVALSGDGGDEIFGGYNRYVHGERMLQRFSRLPAPARRALGAALTWMPAAGLDRVLAAVGPGLPASLRQRLPGQKLHKVGRLLGSPSVPTMYRSLMSAWQDPDQLVIDGQEPEDPTDRVLASSGLGRLAERMMLADQLRYLPDDLLAKVDRASMAVSLEARVPLLDHHLVEFAWRLPFDAKIRGDTGKWILRQVLYRRVPRDLVDRPKMGFSVPVDAWLRGPLKAWATDLLDADSLRAGGLLNGERIAQAWRSFQAGGPVDGLAMWTVLMFQAWYRRWHQ